LATINFALVEQLKAIPHVRTRLAKAIVAVREDSGYITRDNLQTICRRKLSPKILAVIDCTQNKSLSTNRSDQLIEDKTTKEVDIKSNTRDWMEMVNVVKAATTVLVARKQQQQPSGSTLGSYDQTFAKKSLT
jgi:hypothetical protein